MKKVVSILLCLLMLLSILPTAVFAVDTNLLAEANPGFEEGTDSPTGWTISGVANGSAVLDTTQYSEGTRSYKLTDTNPSAGIGVYGPAVAVGAAGTEYIMLMDYYAESGYYDLMLEYRKSNNTRDVAYTTTTYSIGKWDTLSAVGACRATSTGGVRAYLNSISANTGTVYFDNVRLYVLTEELLEAHIDRLLTSLNADGLAAAHQSRVTSNNTADLLRALKTTTGGITGVVDANKNAYITDLTAARAAKDAALTLEEVQDVVTKTNSVETLKKAKAALETAGTAINLYNTGEVALPTVVPSDVTAAWTAVAGTAAARFTVEEGVATLNSLPDNTGDNETAELTLTLTHGLETATVLYTVTIYKDVSTAQLAALCDTIRAGVAEDTLNALKNEAFGFSDIVDANASWYQTGLAEALEDKGSDLTKPELQAAIDAANTAAADDAAVEAAKAALEAAAEIEMKTAGNVPLPTVPAGITAQWTAVSSEAAEQVLVSGGVAVLPELPDEAVTATLTLKLTKGEAERTVDFALKIAKQLLKRLDVANPSFESADAEGYPTDWTISNVVSQNPETGAIVTEAKVSDAQAFDGERSAYLQDYSTSVAVGLRSAPIPIQIGYEYVVEVMYKGSGTATVYIEFRDSAGTTRVGVKTLSATATDTWQKITGSLAAPAGATNLNVLIYSTQGAGANDVYYDDVRVFEVTPDYLVDKINDAVAADDAEAVMALLQNGALELTLVDGHEADYLAALKAEDAPLTLETLKAAVQATTDKIEGEDMATLNAMVAALDAENNPLTLTETGVVDIPSAVTSDIAAYWSAVRGADADRFRMRNQVANLLNRPLEAEGDGSAVLTLHLSKGTQEVTVDYEVTIRAWTGDEDMLVRLAETLTWEDIKGANTSSNDVRTALILPAKVFSGAEEAAITWSVDPADVIDTTSGAVNRPAYNTAGTAVTLTATLSANGKEYEKDFLLIVTGMDADAGRRLDIQNPGFEDGLNHWLPAYLQGTFQADDTFVYTGEQALLVADPDIGSSAAVRSAKVRGIQEGLTYRLSVMAFADQASAKPYAYIEFWDNDGVLLQSKYATYPSVGKWALLSTELVAPVGATQVSVLLYSGGSSSGDCFFDDVVVTELPRVQNQNLSCTTGWTAESGDVQLASGAITLSDGAVAKSTAFTAYPGQTYAAAADYDDAGAGAKLAIAFYDSGDQLLEAKEVAAETGGTYAVYAKAPEKAAKACVLLTGAAQISNIQLYHTPDGVQVTTLTGTGANLVSNAMPTFGGMDYEAIAAVKSPDNATMTLRFFDINDAKILETTATADENGVLRIRETAPYQTYYATITTTGSGETTFDGIAFYPVTNTVSNASFENVNMLLVGTFPYQWQRDGNVVALPDSLRTTQGTQSLVLRGLDANAAGGVYSSMIHSIQAGVDYTASINAAVDMGSAKLLLNFYDANYTLLGCFETPISASGWTDYSVEGTAPAGAAYASLAVCVEGKAVLYLDEAAFSTSVIDVAGNTQLFIDDYLVASTTDVTREIHKAEKTEPVLTVDYPWESSSAYMYGTVLYDEEEHIYKMWYQAGNFVCYATSEDGVNWTKPLDLGVYEWNGSTDNNIIGIYHIANVFKDTDEPDPDQRYKMVSFNFDYNTTYSYYCYYTSPDGIHWSEPTEVIYSYDVINIAYDDVHDQYVGVVKIFEYNAPYRNKRIERIVVSDDLIHWSEPIRMNALGDLTDAEGYLRADSYGCALYCVGGTAVGFNWVYSITNNDGTDGYVDVELVYSREFTEDFQRVSYDPIIERGADGTWDDEMIYTAAYPIRVGDELWLYYGGWDGDHLCDSRTGKTAIAKWRLDGFVSLNGGENGVIETKPLVFDGNALQLNADATAGSLRVELVGADGAPIQGFAKEDCDPIVGDDVAFTVSWNGKSDLSELAGEIVSMKFYCTNSKLYSFQFVQQEEEEEDTPAVYQTDLTVGPNGTASVAPVSANVGTRITLTVTPDAGYEVDQVRAVGLNGTVVELEANGDGTYTYRMPVGGVKITVTFREMDGDTWKNPFTDVPEGAWFYEAVQYTCINGLFEGTADDRFEPDMQMTRAMMATVLYRLEGEPAHTGKSIFKDVQDPAAWYYDAVLWAADNGIVDGFDNEEFRPNEIVTREQMVTMVYRYDKVFGSGGKLQGAAEDLSVYSDWDAVQGYAREAFIWACTNGLVDGVTDTTLVPAGATPRSHVAKILMEYHRLLRQ